MKAVVQDEYGEPGDAVTAGASWTQAIELAAEAAGIAIGQMGSVAVNLRPLESAVENF